MRQKIKPFESRFIQGITAFVSRLTGISIDLCHRIEQTGTQHLLSEYSRFARARGGNGVGSHVLTHEKMEDLGRLLSRLGPRDLVYDFHGLQNPCSLNFWRRKTHILCRCSHT